MSSEPAAAAAALIAHRLRDAVRRRGSATLALSGGGTTPPMLAALTHGPAPWGSVSVFQVDERVAPDGDPDRNAEQLAPLRGLAREVRAMPVTAGDLRAAARRYGAALPARFDVVHLGIGADGHTASWPPGDPDVRTSPRSVELVAEFNGRPRMTLTRRVVNGARARVVLAVGAEKRPIVERWLLDDKALPITAVSRTATYVFLDDAAAPSATLYERRN